MTYQQMHVYEYFQSAFHILYGYSLQLARMAYFELKKYRNRIPETCMGESMFLTLRRLTSYIYGAPILDVSRSHTTTQHSR